MAQGQDAGVCVAEPSNDCDAATTDCFDVDSGDAALDGGGAGDLDTQSQILFPSTAVGESTTETLELRNIGSGPLAISAIRLAERAGGEFDGVQELYLDPSSAEAPVTLAPMDAVEISITFTPENDTRDAAELVIESNDPADPVWQVDVQTMSQEPHLIVDPESVRFHRVPPRPSEPDWVGEDRMVTIQNVGAATLRIDDIYIAGSDRFSWSIPDPDQPGRDNDSDQWPTTLESSESFELRVTFQPEDQLPETGELIIGSNDPNRPETVVELAGNSGAPCLRVSPSDEIAFGPSSIGQTSQKRVFLENCSRTVDLVVEEISLTDDGGGVFSLASGDLQGTIAPGERSTFSVTLVPQEQRDYSGELYIASNDPALSEVRVPLSGTGSDNSCPTAVAKAWLPGGSASTSVQTSPHTTVQLDGSDSYDSDGSIDRYEWTILSRPQGSTSRLSPNNSVEQPTLLADLAGTYEIELTAYDNENMASCGSAAILTILAEPDGDIHIQLVWNTPADPNQTDDFGSDFDLHYLHPNGSWNQPPWAIYWGNPTADWGVQGDSSDNPSLNREDDDGAGPEDLSHSGLQSSLDYRVGVHYYEDNSLGTSDVTVRIYVGGNLQKEFDTSLSGTGIFWDVATIGDAGQTITPINQTHQGIP